MTLCAGQVDMQAANDACRCGSIVPEKMEVEIEHVEPAEPARAPQSGLAQ
jgi:hypothetical protein